MTKPKYAPHSTTTSPSQSLIKCLCLRCKYEWWPKKPGRPFTCPKCRSPYWDVPRKEKKIVQV